VQIQSARAVEQDSSGFGIADFIAEVLNEALW
jgi:hypothetical protein